MLDAAISNAISFFILRGDVTANRCGADALVRAGPALAAAPRSGCAITFREADEGVGRGPGGPPHFGVGALDADAGLAVRLNRVCHLQQIAGRLSHIRLIDIEYERRERRTQFQECHHFIGGKCISFSAI